MSQYGETFNISNNHQIDIKAKLDSLLSKNTEIEVNNDQVEAKLDVIETSNQAIKTAVEILDNAVSGNEFQCDVVSSVLPTGASDSSKQDEIKVKLDTLETSNQAIKTAVEILDNAVSGNEFQCDVVSSVLPTGASDSSKQDEIKVKLDTLETSNQAIKTAVEGTLTVSAPAVTKSSSTPISSQSVNGQSDFTSAEIDINTAKNISILAESSDTANSHEIDIEVSNSSGGTYYPTSHSGFFISGKCHILVNNIPYRYIKVKVKNGDSAVGNSADFTVHLLQSN